ncbi:hypothetical protein M2133_000668 [Parabacteroides sp. PF5-6]|nr:hypothetical protein [Parabacteroides sp. PF5-6]
MGETMIKCPECGSVNGDWRKECVYCYARLDVPGQMQIYSNRPPAQVQREGHGSPQPVVVNNYISQTPNYIVVRSPKSLLLQFFLILFFGVFGLLYSSISGFFIIALAYICSIALTVYLYSEYLIVPFMDILLGGSISYIIWIFWSVIWAIACFIWGAISINRYNDKLYSGNQL